LITVDPALEQPEQVRVDVTTVGADLLDAGTRQQAAVRPG
jgi:hypothetical protein